MTGKTIFEISPVFRYITGHLSVLSEDDLAHLDYDAAISLVQKTKLSGYEKREIKKLLNAIQVEIGVKHYGILGMKWGVRRYQNTDGSLTSAGRAKYRKGRDKTPIFGQAERFSVEAQNGNTIDVEPLKPPSTAKKIMNVLFGNTDDYVMGRRGDANYTLNLGSKSIGELSLIDKSPGTAYIDWITVYDEYRGNGYATDVLNNVLIKAKQNGYSHVELNALKDARPLYERLGFTYKDTSQMGIMERVMTWEWGCKHMEYDLTKLSHSDYENYLIHYGILGMKWGVRRYQNKDGTLTAAGKKRRNGFVNTEEIERQRKDFKPSDVLKRPDIFRRDQMAGNQPDDSSTKTVNAKKVAAAAAAIGTVAAAAYIVHKNPEAIGKIVAKVKDSKVSELSAKAVKKGMEYTKKAVKSAASGVKEGIKEGIHDAPKKAAKTIVTGIVLNATKRALDNTLGKEESARIFQANDNKKIAKFWKVQPEDSEEKDDE